VIAVRPPVVRLNHVLGALAAVCTAVAIWPWFVPPIPTSPPSVEPSVAAPALSPANLPGLSTYAAIVERPLFVPSRRPPPTATTSIEGRYRLLGIVGAGPKRRAFVADGARRIEIGEGDAIDGWTVNEIEPDRVLLTSPAGEAAALKLSRAAPETAKPEPGKPQ
jgi:hypothetical protein